jgi:hypothetical protein
LKGSSCGQCPGPGTEILTFDQPTYELLQVLAAEEGLSVAEALTKRITLLAKILLERERCQNITQKM